LGSRKPMTSFARAFWIVMSAPEKEKGRAMAAFV
jgi:hypothetical protein